MSTRIVLCCNGCGVLTTPFTPAGPGPAGWLTDFWSGGPRDWCPECQVVREDELDELQDEWLAGESGRRSS